MLKEKLLLKLVSLILVMTFGMAMFAACGAEKNTATEQEKTQQETTGATESEKKDDYSEKVKIRIVSRDLRQNDEPIVDDDSVVDFIEKKFNVELDLVYVPSPQATEVFEKLNLMVASGDYPDIMESTMDAVLANNLHTSLVKKDMLVNIREYVAANPGKYPEIEATTNNFDSKAFEVNGDLYQIPRFIGPYPHAWFIRQDWLDKLKLKMPTNYDELYSVLQAFAKEDPDGKKNTGMTLPFYSFWNGYFYSGFTGSMEWAVVDGKYTKTWTMSQQKDAVKYAKKLFDEGLLDKEVFVHKAPDARAKFSSGRAGVIISPIFYFNEMKKNLTEYNPDAKIAILPVDFSGPNAIARFRGNNYFMAMAVKKDSDNVVKRKMDLLEYMLSDEGDNLFINGIEGVHYTKDSSGKMVMNKEIYQKEKWGLEGLAQCHGLRRIVDVSTAVSQEVFGEHYKDIQGVFDGINEIKEKIPTNPLDRIVTDAEKELGSALTDYITKWETMFLTGEKDIDSSWDEFLEGYKKAGYDKVEAEINTKFKP